MYRFRGIHKDVPQIARLWMKGGGDSVLTRISMIHVVLASDVHHALFPDRPGHRRFFLVLRRAEQNGGSMWIMYTYPHNILLELVS